MKQSLLQEQIGLYTLRFFVLLVLLFLGLILWEVFSKGGSAIGLDFIFDYPRKGMTLGGIFPTIMGTIFVTLVTTVFAIPLV